MGPSHSPKTLLSGKAFSDKTIPNVTGYPLYRRRSSEQVEMRDILMDNNSVVPYSPYLLLKYNAHFNVEIRTSLRAIKYIYKYIYIFQGTLPPHRTDSQTV